jgi:hypothetical protein
MKKLSLELTQRPNQQADISFSKNTKCVVWEGSIRLIDLVPGIGNDPNTRDPNLKSKVAKAVRHTLRYEPQMFYLKNQGIDITCDNFWFDKQNQNKVHLELPELSDNTDTVPGGIINGFTTYSLIQEALTDSDVFTLIKNSGATVRITFLVNCPVSEWEQIVKARNASNPQEQWGLGAIGGQFDSLISEIEKYPTIANQVNTKPGGPKPHDLDDLIRLVSLFRLDYSLDQWIEHDKHPISSATSIGSVVNGYTYDAYKPLHRLIPDFVQLDNLIREEYQRQLQDGRIRSPHGVSKTPYISFNGEKFDYTLNDPLTLPLISAFRILLVNANNKLAWKGNVSIKDVWETHQAFFRKLVSDHRKLVQDIVEAQDIPSGKLVLKRNITMNGVSRSFVLWDSPVKKIAREFKLN